MNFNELNDKGLVDGYAIVKTVEIKQTTKGAYYLDLTLSDNSGEINAKLWDYNGTPKLNAFDFVYVMGTLSKYNETLQLRLETIRAVTDEDDVDMSEYVSTAEIPGEVMFDELYKIAEDFDDEQLRLLVTEMLFRNKQSLVYWPAAKSNHHALRGGLLMHTLSILRIAQGVCNVYEFVNKDLLYTGVILHDIAKLEEMGVSPVGIAGDYTTRGQLIGHLVGGAMMVERAGRELEIDPELLTLVEHMLISHHGQPEWGAAKVPMFIEAEILSQLDVLDARMYEMHFAISDTEPCTFSVPQKPLGNRAVYNHGMQTGDGTKLM